mmetsp:Transcript_15083/g.16760  ORF Transcript_15083/g.16760 Transcript_15083/m.16760 type:complete len:114 (+) Transcript_15083:169-510(+)
MEEDYEVNIIPNDPDKKYQFTKDMQNMLCSFGDTGGFDSRTVELMEDYLMEFIQNLLINSEERAQRRGSTKLQQQDLMYFIQNDPKKIFRVKHLLRMSKAIEESKKKFDPTTA